MNERNDSSSQFNWVGLCVLLLLAGAACGFGWLQYQRATLAVMEAMESREIAEFERAKYQAASELAAASQPAADGGSTGQPIVPELYLNQDLWQHVETLANASPDAKVFTLGQVSGELRFGDGNHGAAPPARKSTVQATYQVGNGGTITVFLPDADLHQKRLRAARQPDGTVRLELTDPEPDP